MECLLIKCHKKRETELPFSLIESNILPRLPAKSVGRCLCVCKQWNSFLSTQSFARMHLHHVTINDYKLLLLDGRSPAVTFRTLDEGSNTTIRCNPDPSAQFILASLDGLVCLASRETSSKLAFWNPLTGAYRKLSSNVHFNVNLITSNEAIGFYKDSSNDYKLLCVIYGGLLGAFIYSNRLDSWKEVEVSIPFKYVRPMWSPATTWGGCLYFVVAGYNRHIMCFDVKEETFRIIPSPPGLHARDDSGSFVILNGALHLCVSYNSFGCLWRMDDDGGWVEVAAYNDMLRYRFSRQHICITSIGDWLAVLEENKYSAEKMDIEENNYSFEKMNTEDFRRRYRNPCSLSWNYRSSRMMYLETLVSPNPWF